MFPQTVVQERPKIEKKRNLAVFCGTEKISGTISKSFPAQSVDPALKELRAVKSTFFHSLTLTRDNNTCLTLNLIAEWHRDKGDHAGLFQWVLQPVSPVWYL